jgi:hypothetical protein
MLASKGGGGVRTARLLQAVPGGAGLNFFPLNLISQWQQRLFLTWP